jgi:cell division protein FtsX
MGTDSGRRRQAAATWLAATGAVVGLFAAVAFHARYNSTLAASKPASGFEGWGTGAGWAILSILAWLVFVVCILITAVGSIAAVRAALDRHGA